uniref:Uncharacterized protein n=1 Tax=Oryza punctata TaxID=4537 RepID=A0A0E0JPJ1_ORYPU
MVSNRVMLYFDLQEDAVQDEEDNYRKQPESYMSMCEWHERMTKKSKICIYTKHVIIYINGKMKNNPNNAKKKVKNNTIRNKSRNIM